MEQRRTFRDEGERKGEVRFDADEERKGVDPLSGSWSQPVASGKFRPLDASEKYNRAGDALVEDKPGLRTSPSSSTLRGLRGQGPHIEGWLKKKRPGGLKFLRVWQRRYFIYFPVSNEIRYYKGCKSGMFGSLPLKQKGSIPLELVDFIEIPDKDKYAGCRFNLVSKRYGKFHHPRHHQDDRGLQVTERRFCLYAPDIAERKRWVDFLTPRCGRSNGFLASQSSRALVQPDPSYPVMPRR